MRYGIISQIDYSKGVAKVFIDELGIVTDWLTLPKNINENWVFNIKQQVAVIFNGEDGEILHTVPSTNDNPPSWANDHVEGFQFKDGTKVIYDNTSKKLSIDAGTGTLEFTCSKLKVTGDVVAGDNEISLLTHIHTTPVGPSGVPL